MQAWKQKAIKDTAKALLPFQASLRKLVRAVRPYETNRLNDSWLMSNILSQLKTLRQLGIAVADRDVVELGTGWNPILPLLYARSGARRVVTVDQERLLDAHTVRYALHMLDERATELQERGLAQSVPLPNGVAAEHRSLHELLASANVDYRAPFDFRKLPSASADLIVSRDVLEHIPERLLKEIMAESRRILAPGGVICHTIDMSDHWEHGDKSISRVNFLQYDGGLWDLAGLNPQNYQNRLRRYEYVALFEAAGFEILQVTDEPDPKALRALSDIPLCARYRDTPHGELAVLQTTVVGRRRADASVKPVTLQ